MPTPTVAHPRQQPPRYSPTPDRPGPQPHTPSEGIGRSPPHQHTPPPLIRIPHRPPQHLSPNRNPPRGCRHPPHARLLPTPQLSGPHSSPTPPRKFDAASTSRAPPRSMPPYAVRTATRAGSVLPQAAVAQLCAATNRSTIAAPADPEADPAPTRQRSLPPNARTSRNDRSALTEPPQPEVQGDQYILAGEEDGQTCIPGAPAPAAPSRSLSTASRPTRRPPLREHTLRRPLGRPHNGNPRLRWPPHLPAPRSVSATTGSPRRPIRLGP